MVTVVTHSGRFDPDDVFAIATLQLHLGENIRIIRTRDETVIAEADWVIDVGGAYDVSRKHFDHHMPGAPVRDNGVPYAAFGLVWKHLGGTITGSAKIAEYIEKRVAQPIDAGDNRLPLYKISEHNVSPFLLYNVVDSFMPIWGSGQSIDEAFTEAVDFARGLLQRLIKHAIANVQKMDRLREVYEQSTNKSILEFDEPVDQNDLTEFNDVHVVVCPVESSRSGKWRAAVVPHNHEAFENRAEFPEAWAGLEVEELARVSGIPDAVFCHKKRYWFVSRSKEGAVQAAQLAERHFVPEASLASEVTELVR